MLRSAAWRFPFTMILTSLALMVGCASTTIGSTRSREHEGSLEYGVWDSPGPPPLKLMSGKKAVLATQGSSCWGNECVDMATPRASNLPTISSATLHAMFLPSGDWGVSISGGTSGACR